MRPTIDDKLATVGLKHKVDEINRIAVKVARQVASEGDALVAGDRLFSSWSGLGRQASR
jgi:methionine synthase I (cobalamin-dependent)